MDTPDTEWEKEFDEVIDKAWDKHGEQYEVYDPKSFASDIKDFITKVISSRDTYWKERVRKEFGDFAHEHYLGCHADEVGKWHYSYDTEVVYLVDAYLEKITSEDNLK